MFPDYEGVSGALSKSRKDHIPKAKQTPELWGAWEGWAGTQEWVGARVATALGL